MYNDNDEPIRILHIVTIMNRAGLETMLMNYYRNIDRKKIQFDFLVHRFEEGEYDNEIETLGGRIYNINPISLKHGINYKNELSLFLKGHKEYKIVHSHLDSLSNFPLRICKECEIPIRIAHSHTNYFDKDLKFLIRQVCKSRIKRYATHFFGCSEEAISFMFGKKCNGTVINNAIDIEKFNFNFEVRQNTRNELKVSDNFVIGNVGRFNAVKNHKFLISIFCEVKKTISEAKLILVGEGNEMELIKEKINELSLSDDVLFLGARDNVNEIMQAMDCFVLPSLYEGLGIVLIEAQSTGLPCVTSKDRVPLTAKITDLIEYIPLENNPSEWSEHIINLYKKTRNRSSQVNRIIDSNYEIKTEAKKLQKFYLEHYNDV